MQVIRNLLSGDKNPLPDWDNAGRYFKGGLALTLAIYSLYIPGIILTVVGWIAGMREIFHLITLATGADRPDAVMADLGFSLTKLLAKLTVGGLLSLLLMPIVFLTVPAMVIWRSSRLLPGRLALRPSGFWGLGL